MTKVWFGRTRWHDCQDNASLWSIKGIQMLLLPLDGMLVHHSFLPSILSSCPDNLPVPIYTRRWRGSPLKVSVSFELPMPLAYASRSPRTCLTPTSQLPCTHLCLKHETSNKLVFFALMQRNAQHEVFVTKHVLFALNAIPVVIYLVFCAVFVMPFHALVLEW